MCIGVNLLDALKRRNTIHLRHGNIHQNKIGMQFVVFFNTLCSVFCLANNIVSVLG